MMMMMMMILTQRSPLDVDVDVDVDDDNYSDPDPDDPIATASSIIILRRPTRFTHSEVSHDRSMIAIYGKGTTIMLYSIDKGNKSTNEIKLTLKHSLPMSYFSDIEFTQDDKYISYCNRCVLFILDTSTRREIMYKLNHTYNKYNDPSFCMGKFSPAGSGRRFLVRKPSKDEEFEEYYIVSVKYPTGTLNWFYKQQQQQQQQKALRIIVPF
jgi:hypothetical protein